jgi:hypothetical protein
MNFRMAPLSAKHLQKIGAKSGEWDLPRHDHPTLLTQSGNLPLIFDVSPRDCFADFCIFLHTSHGHHLVLPTARRLFALGCISDSYCNTNAGQSYAVL